MGQPRRPIVKVRRPRAGQCMHPQTRKPGYCGRNAIDVFDIPDDYVPGRRHSETPDIDRPRAALCLQHAAKLEAHKAGVPSAAGSHEAQCAICRHPDAKRVEAMWVSWALSTGDAMRELGVSQSTFYHHVEHFDLWTRKAGKVNTKRALVIAAERGFSQGGHSARTALVALQLLAKERGDVERVDIALGIANLAQLSDEELAQQAEQLAAQLRGPRALPDGATVIDVTPAVGGKRKAIAS